MKTKVRVRVNSRVNPNPSIGRSVWTKYTTMGHFPSSSCALCESISKEEKGSQGNCSIKSNSTA